MKQHNRKKMSKNRSAAICMRLSLYVTNRDGDEITKKSREMSNRVCDKSMLIISSNQSASLIDGQGKEIGVV